MDNGCVKPGTRLGNVVVSIENGNTWASNGQGEFAFAVGADNAYVISAVKKDGYALADPDIIGRRLGYSASPLFLILEIPAEKMRQQLDIELKVRAILMDRIKAKEACLEKLLMRRNTFDVKRYIIQRLIDDFDKFTKKFKEERLSFFTAACEGVADERELPLIKRLSKLFINLDDDEKTRDTIDEALKIAKRNSEMTKEEKTNTMAEDDGIEILKVCPVCNTGNHEHAAYCIKCGNKFE